MVSGLLQINQASLPSVYLGIPLFFGNARHLHFQKILDSIRLRLVGCKTKCLSFAGRLILVRHVLSSILLYISLVLSLVLPLPTKTCLLIERMMRNFLCSTNIERLKSNLVRWETVYLPRSEGGLGLRRVKEFIQACLLKLAWSAISTYSLWANWFRERYFKGNSMWHPRNPRGGSCIWKSLSSFSSLIQRNSRWVIGNGQSILLWFNNWIDHDPIATRFPNLQFSELDLVTDILVESSWHIPNQLPSQLKDFLTLSTNSMIIGDSSSRDHLLWPGSGPLSIKAAWNMLRTRATKNPWFRLIWNNLVNPRLACFSWRLLQRKTPTKSWAKQRGWSLASRCFNCLNEEESDFHLFFSCNLAIQLWNWVLSPYGVHSAPLFSASVIWEILAKGKDVVGRKCAAAIFFHTIFTLWFLRNDSKHNSKKSTLERAKIILMEHLKGLASPFAGLKVNQGKYELESLISIDRPGLINFYCN